jgi:hypothetical protein
MSAQDFDLLYDNFERTGLTDLILLRLGPNSAPKHN